VDISHYLAIMEQLRKADLDEMQKDHVEIRSFVKEISLKLRRHKSQDEDTHPSLYEMVIDQ
jgi:hypothetical protein